MEKLDREMLFAIVADAAFQDGQLEAYEKKILEQLSTFLKLDSGLAMAIARQAKQRFAEGKLGPARRLDGEAVYLRCLQVAIADGMLEEDEEELLQAMRGLFRISGERHQELMGRARKGQSEIPPPAGGGGAALPANAAATRAALDAHAASILSSLEANPDAYKPSEDELMGKKRSQVNKRFRLQTGGLPIPFWVNMIMAGLAGALLLGGMVFSQRYLPERFPTTRESRYQDEDAPRPYPGSREDRRRRRNTPQSLAFAVFALLSSGAYWGMRRGYEARLLGEGAEIRVTDGALVLPAFLGGEGRSLSRTDVDSIVLGVTEEGLICSLTFAVKGGRTLRFGAGSLADPAGLAAALGEHFGVPANKETYSFLTNHLETILAGGLALLGAGILFLLLS